MLEPWAEISERLRRIHPNFKLRHYLHLVPMATTY